MSWLFKLYCLPGRLAVAWQYLFPRSFMEAVQSRRQRDSTFAHFLISTPVWAFVIWVAVSAIRGPDTSTTRATAVDPAVPETAIGRTQGPTGIVGMDDRQMDAAVTPVPASVPASENVEAVTLSPDTPEIARAVAKAFQSGHAERWSANGEKGYAIPSALEPMRGCRRIYYSVDSSGFQSAPQEVCS